MKTMAARDPGRVTSGIVVLGVGVLLVTGWWWPGIVIVIGAALCVERLLQGRVRAAAVIAALLIALPLAIALSSRIDIPGSWVAGFALVALGGFAVARGLGYNGPGTRRGSRPPLQ